MPALLDLRMPGVYTQEVPTLPPAVGVIPSAVPVFIGYTEKAEKNGDSLLGKPTRIKSMQEYENWFGGAPTTTIQVDVDDRESNPRRPEVRIVETSELFYKMYHSLQLYYANGGGPCFIMSVAEYEDTPVAPVASLFGLACFNALKKVKDVTILVFPDGTSMAPSAYTGIIQSALQHCEKMKNRVTIIDVHDGDNASTVNASAEAFQNSMPSDIEIKKYGMGYYPYLTTNLSYGYTAESVSIQTHQQTPTQTPDSTWVTTIKGLVTALGTAQTALSTAVGDDAVTTAKEALVIAKTNYDNGVKNLKGKNLTGGTLAVLEYVNNAIYNKIIEAIRNFGVIMPPSPAIAGIYVRTDATQGVWKAPANVSVFGTIKPSIELDDDDHALLNAPDNGKAINVIRAYPGRGILVYGGRTLAGNDLEWRYVNVRRTFCFIEDSIARAMQDFVFEPNTSQTWIKVKSMIGSFLNTLWKAGALYGDTPDAAYQVIVGEPESMSVQDVLGGIMRVIIKVAVARPAEFIVLQYEHKFELTEA
ncbi:phage tail sheath family protein [Haliscomenobacter sp.]|uniref:phage tail sheath family protein n=1 Tax=Haliscomenobacter sp. TaxID=2717303 RepID=UPI0035934958